MENPLFAKKPLSLIMNEMSGENRLRRVLGPGGRLLAVSELRDGQLRPLRVMVTPADLDRD